MYNTVASSAAATKPTTPITDAVLAGGTVGSGTKPLPGAQTQTAAGTAPATADAGNTAQSPAAAATSNATTTVAGATGATGANLVMTPDGEPADAAAATLAAAANAGKSVPGKADSLVTGSSDVVAAKTAIRTGAIDPTTTGQDAKTAAAAGAKSTSADPAASSLANGGDANGTNAARPANPAGADPAAAVRSQPSDAAKADPAATAGAAATPSDTGTTPATAGTSTTAATVGGTEATSTTHHAAHAGATRAMPGPVPAFDQIALSVNRAAADGLDRITIQLRPESLGRVDVHLQLGHDGRMTATFVADRQDTLDMLQRDARGLERALNDAGLRTDTGGLSFNLRGDGREFGNPAQNMAQGTQDSAGGDAGDTETTAEATRPGRAVNGLLDISV
jgi:flagellar hook-length control protein FliK